MELINEVLDLAKIEAGRMELDIETVDLPDLVQETLSQLEGQVQAKGVPLRAVVPEGLHAIDTDPGKLRQVVINLVGNALKFTPEKGTITIDAKSDDGFVIVSTKDTGIGMTKEQLDHVFEEFYKADKARHELASSGLGLSICQRIVDTHGGRIWAESEGLGKGSTISFSVKPGGGESGTGKEEKVHEQESHGG